jgi:hypothetical protein
MATRKKGGEKGGTPTLDNDFSTDDAQEFFDKLEEISNRAKEDAAGARGDINAVYDAMVEKLGVDKESAKFLWNRHAAEQRFKARAKKMDTRPASRSSGSRRRWKGRRSATSRRSRSRTRAIRRRRSSRRKRRKDEAEAADAPEKVDA